MGEAANGREAVEKAIKLKPDVAILDIGMPELHGFEATQQIVEAFLTPKFSFSQCMSPIRWCAEHWMPELADTF